MPDFDLTGPDLPLGASPDDDAQILLHGLKALSDSAFPKHCKTCGRVYERVEDYVLKTADINQKKGFKASLDDDDQPIIELYRNCECGSTLMDFFSERRDSSERGLRRRQVFGKAVDLLMRRGLDEKTARLELIKVMQGQESKLIQSLGLNFSVRRGV